MKKTLTILLILSYKLIFSQSLVISKQYQFSLEKPILVKAGNTVLFQADSIYLINSGRLKFYEDLRKLLNKDLDCSNIINTYENSIINNNNILNELLANSLNSKKIIEETLLETSKSLTVLNQKLKENDIVLFKTKEELKQLKKQLKKDKIKRTFSFGTIGIIGIATGILISKL